MKVSLHVLQSKSMDWFLYDNGLRHEIVNRKSYPQLFWVTTTMNLRSLIGGPGEVEQQNTEEI